MNTKLEQIEDAMDLYEIQYGVQPQYLIINADSYRALKEPNSPRVPAPFGLKVVRIDDHGTGLASSCDADDFLLIPDLESTP
jgi:hypothetical protein